ncbi:MAG: glycosidase [Bacteroidetes bacterium]|nr:glycosidase [Bacteroidota bacterium]
MSRINVLSLMLIILITAACQSPTRPSGESWALLPFEKIDSVNPVLTPGSSQFECPIRKERIAWDAKDVFNPAAVVRDGKVWLLFRAEDTVGRFAGTSRIGVAVSEDGLHFDRDPEPVFYPDEDSMKVIEWEGGVEDPRVVERPDGLYVMTYTAYDGKLARLCVATSPDLVTWKKEGTAFPPSYLQTWSKSGAIVAERKEEKIVATKVNGKYWMYWGDTNLFLANSDDCIHWSVMEESGKPKPVLQPRPGKFDSRLVESGPYALLTQAGILLLYNGMNLDTGGDPSLPAGAYCSGQVLFEAKDPSNIISRMDGYFMKPDKPYEQTGQVSQVCFIEGMVPFKGNWLLYYGTADSKIAVASSPFE